MKIWSRILFIGPTSQLNIIIIVISIVVVVDVVAVAVIISIQMISLFLFLFWHQKMLQRASTIKLDYLINCRLQ